MEQDKHVNLWGLTGDPEIDRHRKQVSLNRIKQIRKKFMTGQQVDLFYGTGGTARPAKKNSQFKKDQKAIMVALALDLHEHIPVKMAAKYGFDIRPGSDENPPTNYVDDGEAPF